MKKYINQHIVNLRLALDIVPANILGQSVISNQEKTLRDGKKDKYINEIFIVQKCNCVELYFVVSNVQKETISYLIRFWKKHAANLTPELQSKIVVEKDYKAALHLFRVAASLESLLIGDAQVLGQIRSARKMAEKEKALGSVLRCLLRSTDIVGSRVRRETKLCFGNVSVSGATSELVCKLFNKNPDKILIIGMGKMGRLIAAILSERLPKKYIFVCNRTARKASIIAKKYGLNFQRFSEYLTNLGNFKIVVFAIDSSRYLLTPEILKRIKIKNNLIIIDIGNPQSVDPKVDSEKRLTVLNLDNIQDKRTVNLAERQKEIPKVQKIVLQEFELFKKAVKRLGVEDLLANIYSSAYTRGREYRKRLKRISLGFNAEQKQAIENLSFGLITKSLIPIAKIRNLAEKDFNKAVEVAKFLINSEREKC